MWRRRRSGTVNSVWTNGGSINPIFCFRRFFRVPFVRGERLHDIIPSADFDLEVLVNPPIVFYVLSDYCEYMRNTCKYINDQQKWTTCGFLPVLILPFLHPKRFRFFSYPQRGCVKSGDASLLRLSEAIHLSESIDASWRWNRLKHCCALAPLHPTPFRNRSAPIRRINFFFGFFGTVFRPS